MMVKYLCLVTCLASSLIQPTVSISLDGEQTETNNYCDINEEHYLCEIKMNKVAFEDNSCIYKPPDCKVPNPSEIQNILKFFNDIKNEFATGFEIQINDKDNVIPSASNMVEMEWDILLQLVAQLKSEDCTNFENDELSASLLSGYNDQSINVNEITYVVDIEQGKDFKDLDLMSELQKWKTENLDKSELIIYTHFAEKFVLHTSLIDASYIIYPETYLIGCGSTLYHTYFEGRNLQFTFICLLGYKKNKKLNYDPPLNDSLYKIGDPASECPEGTHKQSGTYKNLCKLKVDDDVKWRSSEKDYPSWAKNIFQSIVVPAIPTVAPPKKDPYCEFSKNHLLCNEYEIRYDKRNILETSPNRKPILHVFNSKRNSLALNNKFPNVMEMEWHEGLELMAQKYVISTKDQPNLEDDLQDFKSRTKLVSGPSALFEVDIEKLKPVYDHRTIRDRIERKLDTFFGPFGNKVTDDCQLKGNFAGKTKPFPDYIQKIISASVKFVGCGAAYETISKKIHAVCFVSPVEYKFGIFDFKCDKGTETCKNCKCSTDKDGTNLCAKSALDENDFTDWIDFNINRAKYTTLKGQNLPATVSMSPIKYVKPCYQYIYGPNADEDNAPNPEVTTMPYSNTSIEITEGGSSTGSFHSSNLFVIASFGVIIQLIANYLLEIYSPN